jgi:putative sterol carrier protein
MAVISDYFAVLPRAFRPEQAGGLNITYGFKVSGPQGGTWTIRIGNGQARVQSGTSTQANATITMSTNNYLKLAAGSLDVVAAYRQGKVGVNGDTRLALKFTELFRPWAGLVAESVPVSRPAESAPAQPYPATEPPIYPPGPCTEDYLATMPAALQRSRAGNLNATYQFDLSGEGSGTWTLTVANGQASLSTGGVSNPTVGVAMSSTQFIRMAHGLFNPAQTREQLRIYGNTALAAQLPQLFVAWAKATKIGAGKNIPSRPVTPVPSPNPPQPVTPPPAQPQPISEPQPTPVQPTPTPPQPEQPPAGGDLAPQSNMDRYVLAMANGFRADQARDVKCIYEFQLGGNDGGVWTVDVYKGDIKIYKGHTDPSPTVDVALSTDNFIKLAQGRFNPRQAIGAKQINVRGKYDLALKIIDIFAPWANGVNNLKMKTFTPPPEPFRLPEKVTSSAGPVFPGLVNGGFDHYQPILRDNGEARFWREFQEGVGAGWSLQLISEADDNAARLMDSGVYGKFTQKYFRGNGHNYHIEGRHSQVITGRYGFDLVLVQPVKAEPGRKYTFKGSVVTFFKGPGTPPVHNKLFKQVGIDPTGGQDYSSGSVIWSDRDGEDNKWKYPGVATHAKADAITLFIRITNTEKAVDATSLNTIFMDNFALEG